MANNLFDFDFSLNSGAAQKEFSSLAEKISTQVKKMANIPLGINTKDAEKELENLGMKIKSTFQKVDGINLPTNEIKKYASEFDKLQNTAKIAMREQKAALAQMASVGKEGTAEFNALKSALLENVQSANKFENELKKIDAEIEKIDGQNIDVDFDKDNKASKFKENLGSMGKMAGFAALAGGAALAVVGIKKAIDSGVEFQKTLADFSAITGVQGKALDGFGESAKKMSLQFGGSAVDQLTTYKGILSRLGPDIAKSPEALERMGVAVNTLALASGMDATQSMEAMTTAALQFGVDLSNPIQASKEMTDMINVMAAGAKEGAAEIPQISEALAVSGAVARASGVSFLELNAGIQVMAEGGKYGAEAGTALRNVMVGMQEVSKEGSASLSKLGINSKDLATALQTGGLGGALKVINDKFGESSDQIAKNQVLIDLFGKENIAAGATLVAGADKLETFKGKLQGTQTAFEQAKTNSQTFAHQISLMKANLEDVGLKLFDSLKPALDSVFKLFQDPKLMKGITSLVSNIATGIAPVVEILGTTLAPLLVTIGELIGEVFSALVPPIVALIKPIMELADVLLTALMPVFKSLLPVFGLLVQSVADLLTALMPVIKMAIPLLISSLNSGVVVIKLVSYGIIGIADGLTWLITAITDSIKWIGDLFNSLGKLLGLNPAKKQNEHNESLKAGGVVSKEFNKAMGTTVQQQQLFGVETNKSADATKTLTNNVNENTTNLNANTGATKANTEAKKTLLEQLTELTNKVGAASAIDSKIFADYVIEFNQSAKQKNELKKVTDEAERLAGVLSREIQPIIENFMGKEPLVIPLEHLELTDTGVNYKPITDNIKLNFQESLMASLDEVGNFLQPIPFDIVDVKAIDDQIKELKDSYNAGETDYETYVNKLNDLDKQRQDAVISTSDIIANSLMTVSNAMSEMAVTSLQKFKETGEGLNDFLGQAGIAMGTMMGAALTSSGDQQKQILVQALTFAEKLLSIYAVEIIAMFTTMIPIPYVGTAAGVAAVTGLYTLLEVAKAKIGADQGVVDFNPATYKTAPTSRDVYPIMIRKHETVLTPEETELWKTVKLGINSDGGTYNGFKSLENKQDNGALINEIRHLKNKIENLDSQIKVTSNHKILVEDNRKVSVTNKPIYG